MTGFLAGVDAHPDRTAIRTADGAWSYRDLLGRSERAAAGLLGERGDLGEARVAFLVPAGLDYVATQWGIWRAGGVAVPLALSHPTPELQYVAADADAAIVVVDPGFADRAASLTGAGRRIVSTAELASATGGSLPDVDPQRRAMIVYTSGTTGKPKGVVTTHAHIAAQVASLVEAWAWTSADRIPLVLPLHHIHGIVNVLACAMSVGAECIVPPALDADTIWNTLIDERPTVFMAVPTVYNRLLAAWDAAPPDRQAEMTAACGTMRLMVSGSAALPARIWHRWKEVTGHALLERYGMTEIGMALANPLRAERVPGTVGRPLPGVEVRLLGEDARPVARGTPGEVHVRGPGVFCEYWRRSDETEHAFRDGWFATGDIAVEEPTGFRLMGRRSVDIIKTGGYKVSALEIEEVLREHPEIVECTVVGVADPEWGERVCVAAELAAQSHLTIEGLRAWAKERLAPYKVPRQLLAMALPRNAMGKVPKADVAAQFARVAKD